MRFTATDDAADPGKIELGRQLGALVAAHLIKELLDNGIPAISAELKTLAEAYVVTPAGLVSLDSAEVEAEGGRMTVIVVSLGAGSAATIAASSVLKAFSEAGPEGLNGAANRTTEKLAKLMVKAYKKRGWM